MARRRFNRNQPRDRNGKWTSGGGTSRRASAKKSRPKMSKQRAMQVGRAVGAAAFVGARILAPAARQYVAGRRTASSSRPGVIRVQSMRLDRQAIGR